MPTYEYHCKACDHEFELEQRITEDPIQKCPSCRKKKVKRLISNTSFVLKGSGWYNDGYHGSKNKADKSGTESSASTSGTSTKSSSKSEASSSTKSEANSSKKNGGGKAN